MVGERLLTVLLVAAAAESFAAQSQLAWESELVEGVSVKSRELEPGVFEVTAEGDLEATVQDVEDVLTQVEEYPRFMPYVKEARVLSRKGNVTRAYTRLAFAFMLQPRDYVTDTVVHETSRRGNTFRCSWSSVPAALPENEDVVRVKTNEGAWLARGMGPRTRVTYRFIAAPGGEVPSFAQSFARSEGVLKVFDAIEREANDRAFRRRTYGRKARVR